MTMIYRALLSDDEFKTYLFDRIDSENMFCSDICGYLNYTELEQNKFKNKPNHICLKYNKQLKHGIFHPLIMKCNECKAEENRDVMEK